ncbi:MAG: hypothetical protein M1150_03255 [Patescibacteria group bacterium]|nr:hypothetical protein [Patescibacteria group bacterium]
MTLPKELITVTRTSKILAAIVFVTLPVIAVFAGTTYQASVTPKSTDTNVVSTPKTSTSSATVNWKTYKVRNKFTFNYPSDADLHELENGEVIVSYAEPNSSDGVEMKPGYRLTFLIEKLNSKTLREFIEEEISNGQGKIFGLDKPLTETKVGRYSGYTYTVASEVTTKYIFLPYAEELFIRITENVRDGNNRGYQKTVGQILSTFDFSYQSQTNSTTNWKTYTNTQKNYSFKYPSNGILDDSFPVQIRLSFMEGYKLSIEDGVGV